MEWPASLFICRECFTTRWPKVSWLPILLAKLTSICRLLHNLPVIESCPSSLRRTGAHNSNYIFVERVLASPLRHFYAIDLSRGVAALVVIVWHYQHFLRAVPGAETLIVARNAQPFYNLLWPFYSSGYFAVQFFWMISGFVFAAVYIDRRMSTREFAINRLARLYPLNLITLLVVALLQIVSHSAFGHSQIYVNNDLWHFILNVFFASHWGLEQGYSFNGPVWSVSIEVVVYMAFWITLPFLYRFGPAGPAMFAGICWVLHYHAFIRTDEDAFRCAFYFFAGSVLFMTVTAFHKRGVLLLFASVLLAACGVIVFTLRPHSTDSVGMPLFLSGILLVFAAIDVMGYGRRFRRMRWIGDNTYGTYLWHVPLQIITLIILDYFGIGRAIALQPWFFIGFICATILVARLSFMWIEAPAREWIRKLGQSKDMAVIQPKVS